MKDCLSSSAVAQCMLRGAAQLPSVRVVGACPIADGGDGFLEAVLSGSASGGQRTERVKIRVWDPLARPIEAEYGVINKERCVVEMALASGLWLLQPEERDPSRTSTHGTGAVLRAAVSRAETKSVVIGIGGSATNDGGAGLAQALGYRFFDEAGREIESVCGALLGRIKRIDDAEVLPAIKERRVDIVVGCDVTNPLLGVAGATAVYGPQKGARSAKMQAELEEGLKNLALVAVIPLCAIF
eukprot:TRINITY_DN10541_c0_g1_i1.p1 TRINITY_DN10541_c0_g1~~TRINITY_DN10541_c0_g1_i1.p1  ORF type:complete len:263 (+),score=50.88 TRINITY_DN10541_c0_g1_i1:66-791(+)